MKVLIPCGGTRGDTQPCVAFAVALRKAGHEVKFFAPTTHVKFCRDQGFEPTEFPMDVKKLTEEILGSWDMKSHGASLGCMKKSLDIMQKLEVKQAMKEVLPQFQALAKTFQPDLIVSAHPMACSSVCKKLRIPCVQMSYQLMAPCKECPPMFMNHGLPLKRFPSGTNG